jgi:predicted nucleotidyltransferase
MFHMEQNCCKYEIVLGLLKSPSHARELAKKLNTNHTNILRKLKELSAESVVDFREEGKNKTYFLKNTIESKNYVFMAEKYKLSGVIRKYPQLRAIIEKIQNQEKIRLAVLFGSYAKGIAKPNSDIDVYVETTDKKLKQSISMINTKLSVKIGKFALSSLLIKEIIKDHVIIKGVEEFYEKAGFFD